MFRPVTSDKVPLVTLDDATLLLAEKESRKTIAVANSRIVGSSINLALLSPLAVFGIAKSAKVSRREYWSHDELIKEVARRKLAVLPKTFDESGTALVGGQVVAVALGHTLGGIVAGDLVGNAVAGVSGHVASMAISSSTANVVESATVNAANHASLAASSKFTAGTSDPSYSLPSSDMTATSHLGGVWSGFGQSEVDTNSEQSTGKTTVTVLEETNAETENVQPTGLKGLFRSAAEIASNHFTHTQAVFKNAISSSTPVKTLVTGLTSSFSTTACAVITIVTGTKDSQTVTESFAVPIKYRMKFEIVVNGTVVTGKNLVDDLVVKGKCHESGTLVEWAESIAKFDEGTDLTVNYSGKIAGGKMTGYWAASDGRKGTFDLAHL
ncbi:hypothetical protein HDU98_000318 [Podochytrium sp. JEL0797]|nr:hypothetical protein HDU98_000318 [Podochytrium sp. JEL0797]